MREMREDIFQHGIGSLENVIVPIAEDPEAFLRKMQVSFLIALRRKMVATVDLNNGSMLKAHEVQDKSIKRDLPTKFEADEPTIAQQPPHGGLRSGRSTAHLSRMTAAALGHWTMVNSGLH
jgi:hypothetical protein